MNKRNAEKNNILNIQYDQEFSAATISLHYPNLPSISPKI